MSQNIELSGEDWTEGANATPFALHAVGGELIVPIFSHGEAVTMAASLRIRGDYPKRPVWFEIMNTARIHLLKAKVWDRTLVNRCIREGIPRDPPLPDDYCGHKGFIIPRQTLTRKTAEALIIHASWTSVQLCGIPQWEIQQKVAAVKGLFHGFFNRKNIGRVVRLLGLPTRMAPAAAWTPEGKMASMPVRELWTLNVARHLKVRLFVAWHICVTAEQRDIALVIILPFILSFFLKLSSKPHRTQ